MKKYYYCSVLPKGMKNTYYYIADEEVKVNAFVEFPFGYENTLVIGTVMEVGYFDEDNVPFPVERTKQILRTVSQEEFDNYPGFYAALHDDDDDDIEYELEEAEDYILCEDYDSIFDWAYEHHDRIKSDRIMEMVCRCYEICVENGNPVAALNLGTLYYTGTYLERDYQKAAALYEIAAKAGERRAICNLGYCWYYGRHQAVDYERAYSYFHLAVLLYDDPNSLYKLGDMYRTGKFVEQNDIFAIKVLYSQHGDVFTDMSKVKDASETVKKNIYEFIDDNETIQLVVDCENSDPFKLASVLKQLDKESIQKIQKIDFGKRVCSDGVARYFLLSREGELPPINQVLDRKTDSDNLSMPYIRTSDDAKLMDKYPVLFKRIYAVMKEYGGISVSAQDVHVKIGKIARLSTIKIILNSASWCEHNNSLYKYSDSIITHDLSDEYNGESISSSREKEFYHWLETVKGMPSFDCSRYTSGINILSKSLKSVDPSFTNLYTINDFHEIEEYLDMLKNSIFETLTNNQRVRLKRSIELYIEYLKEKETQKRTVYSPKKSREKEFLLWANFQVGPEITITYSDTLKLIEERCISHNLIPKPFYELDNTFNSSIILNCVYGQHLPR